MIDFQNIWTLNQTFTNRWCHYEWKTNHEQEVGLNGLWRQKVTVVRWQLRGITIIPVSEQTYGSTKVRKKERTKYEITNVKKYEIIRYRSTKVKCPMTTEGSRSSQCQYRRTWFQKYEITNVKMYKSTKERSMNLQVSTDVLGFKSKKLQMLRSKM